MTSSVYYEGQTISDLPVTEKTRNDNNNLIIISEKKFFFFQISRV